jgi:Tol biopolymer transport system component
MSDGKRDMRQQNQRIRQWLWTILVVLICCMAGPRAQYFGRNKVQYEDFSYKVLKTDQFNVYFYPSEAEAAEDAARMLERWHTRLVKLFGSPLDKEQPVILYANHADFQQTNVVGGIIPQGVGGVTEGLRNRIVIPLTGVYAENDHVLGHELVHAFHYDIVKKRGRGAAGLQQVPLWFIEGMSEYLSIGRGGPLTAMWMRDAVVHDDVPSIQQMSRQSEYFPYRFGHALWAYIAGTWGDAVIPSLYNAVIDHGWREGFQEALDVSIDSVSDGWREAVIEEFAQDTAGRTLPAETGMRLAGEQGQTNLSPSISPDGERFVYLSNRELFTLDLYLADAESGKVITKLISSNTDEHFDALRFMNSSGAWSPDGRMLAYAVFKKGDNEIAFFDIESQRVQQTTQLEQIDAITSLAWSPDGEQLALAATSGAISNLYLYTIETGDIEQITDDKYAVLQPSWSPDGNTIAFVTDRGPYTDFDSLVFAPMRIGLLDLQTRQIQTLMIADHAKHINPHFSPDGASLFFVSNPDGFSNIYRYEFDERRFSRVTNVVTGVSGLTELSPALSVAAKTGDMLFTVFDKKGYVVHRLPAAQTSGDTLFSLETYTKNTHLPPAAVEGDQIVSEYLHSPASGLAEEQQLALDDYDPSLGLLYIGQLFLGVSADRFGAGIGGGVSMLFSDLMGEHVLGVAAQISGGIEDFGGQLTYQNRQRRLNWGLALGHIPYRTAQTTSSPDTITVDDDTVAVRNVTLEEERIYNDRAFLFTDYPLSSNRRIELGAGYNRISYDTRQTSAIVRGQTVLSESERNVEDPPPLNLFQSSAAYVGDYSFFGFTGPVNGRRYRVEAEPTVGSLTYLSLLFDYRYYQFIQPVTIAFRGFHYGRYLKDAEDDRLSLLYLGYQTLVRGYSIFSFDPARECEEGNCDEFDRLTGSRIAVFNTEVRVPLLGTDQFGLIDFRYVPLTLLAFLDGGVAWTKNDMPNFILTDRSEQRIPVLSTGLGFRVNVLGLLVMQLYYAYPFQRPDRGPHFGFVIAPGY